MGWRRDSRAGRVIVLSMVNTKQSFQRKASNINCRSVKPFAGTSICFKAVAQVLWLVGTDVMNEMEPSDTVMPVIASATFSNSQEAVQPRQPKMALSPSHPAAVFGRPSGHFIDLLSGQVCRFALVVEAFHWEPWQRCFKVTCRAGRPPIQ